jgi:hypothetical protein
MLTLPASTRLTSINVSTSLESLSMFRAATWSMPFWSVLSGSDRTVSRFKGGQADLRRVVK